MSIPLPFEDNFSSGTDIDTGVYTKIAALTYAVSSGYVRVSDNSSGVVIEGFYTTDAISGDFEVEFKTNQQIVNSGSAHYIGLYIDTNNSVDMYRYWHSTWGWRNPGIIKTVSGTGTSLYQDTTSNGDSPSTAYDIWYKIRKVGQTFTFYTSRDGSNWTERYSGSIADWPANQAWNVRVYSTNNWNSGTYKIDYIKITAISSGTEASSSMNAEISGSIDTNSSRSAETSGEISTASNRPAEISGSADEVSSINAELQGESDATSDMLAEITGSLDSSSVIVSEIHGQDVAVAGRSSEICGRDIVMDDIQAEVHGAASVQSARSSVVHGSESTSADVLAEISGQVRTTSTRAAEIRGGGIMPYCPQTSPYQKKAGPYSVKTSPYEKFPSATCN